MYYGCRLIKHYIRQQTNLLATINAGILYQYITENTVEDRK